MSKFYWVKMYGERSVNNRKGRVWLHKGFKAKNNIEALRRMYFKLKNQGYDIVRFF